MTLIGAIRERYGIRLPPLPVEFERRLFVIDRIRIGFAIPVGRDGGGLFGCVMDRQAWSVESGGVFEVKLSGKEDKMERIVWEIGRAQLERGEEMNDQDWARMMVAVKKLGGAL